MKKSKPFHFKRFSIDQSANPMKVGTDAVILGSLCNVTGIQKVLDVGSGTGVIALMIAQRSKADIDAIELVKENYIECDKNFKNSPWSDRLNAIYTDYLKFDPVDQYDLIISNPPYFDNANNNFTQTSREIARSQVHLTLDDLVFRSASLLSENGRLAVIVPKSTEQVIRNSAIDQGLNCIRSVNIIGRKYKEPTRIMFEFSRSNILETKEELTIESLGRHDYTDEYLRLVADFLFLE